MNGRSLFSVQLFTFLFVLYIKVFYICNHYNFIGMKQTAVNIWRFYLEGFLQILSNVVNITSDVLIRYLS